VQRLSRDTTTSSEPLLLTVHEAYRRDIGRGVVRIDYDLLDEKAVSSGDVDIAEIIRDRTGKHSTSRRRTFVECLLIYPFEEDSN